MNERVAAAVPRSGTGAPHARVPFTRTASFAIEMNTHQVEHPGHGVITVSTSLRRTAIAAGGASRGRRTMSNSRALSIRINASTPRVHAVAGPWLWHASGPGIAPAATYTRLQRAAPLRPRDEVRLRRPRRAIARMKNALTEMVIEGIKTASRRTREIFNHAAFRAGGTDILPERRLGIGARRPAANLAWLDRDRRYLPGFLEHCRLISFGPRSPAGATRRGGGE